MSGPTRLILARHGQAHCNVHGIIGGPRGCTGLTSHGRHQARQLADRLRADHTQDPITAAYTTPLRRARETADIIADHLDLPVNTLDDLREPDYGDADGKPWTDVVAAFGRIPAQHPDHPIATGAETWTAYLKRATTALRDILVRHIGGTVLIVGHGETVTAAAHLFLDLAASVRASAAFAAHYASITRWEQQPLAWTRPGAGWRWTLLTHNDTAHLTR
jgi:2,3-bisphosphoglycerate-dependent phosphoglycerate mutase